MNTFLLILSWYLYIFLTLLFIYFVRHFIFTLNRAFRSQGAMYLGIEDSRLPTVTIFVPAHNEEKVIADALNSLLKQDYPAHLYTIIPLNDRSTDRTKEIIDQFVLLHPGRIEAFHRNSGKAGKSAALKEACENIQTDIIIVFDAI